jgi:hypothetical protein
MGAGVVGFGRHFNKGNSMYANDMLAKNPKVFQVQELPKTALCRENDCSPNRLQKLPNGWVHGLGTVPQPVPKTMLRIRVVLFRKP